MQPFKNRKKVNKNQTGFIEERFICENIRNLYDIMNKERPKFNTWSADNDRF